MVRDYERLRLVEEKIRVLKKEWERRVWIRPCAIFSGSFRHNCNIMAYLAFALIILSVGPSYASEDTPDRLFNRVDGDPHEPWHITADEISYDQKAGQYIARGHVTITKEDRKLAADFVRFDHKTMKAFASGNVTMTVGEDILTGTSVEMDLETETGTINDGTIFFKANHFYIRGKKIQKTGKDSYAVDKASITTCDSDTCDGDTPAWKITGRNLKVTIEGYGYVNHAALWAKKIPVLYTPFLVFPVKLKRQSGLLMPLFGYSERKGWEYTQPFYWAINESSDATFYLHHMGRRGEQIGAEYRYVLDDRSKGTLMYDFLDDRKVDDGTESTEDFAFEEVPGLRENDDRYWLRMKNDQSLPFGFSAKLDIDFVSDPDYLHEFKYGYTGFEKTDGYFLQNFGRDLDEYDDPVRVNSLILSRLWPKYILTTEARWFDDTRIRRLSGTGTTLFLLPLIQFNGSKQPILKSPFYFDLLSEYIHSYRRLGTRIQRADIYPRFYLPVRFKNYFSFEPSLGLRETAWHVDEFQTASEDRTLNREIYDIKLDLSSGIYNVYSLKGNGIERIRHGIRPQVLYDFIPDKDQAKFPDQIGKKNLLTYSITNIFTSKSKKHAIAQGKRQEDEYVEPRYTYNEFLRFKLEQSYDINKAKEDDPQPFSAVYGELQLYPGRYISLYADAEWTHYERDFLSHNVAATMWDKRGDTLSVEHRYTRDSSESIYYRLHLKITDSLSAYVEQERNLFDDKDIRRGTGFLYEAQCWSIGLNHTVEEDDRRYAFMITLYGLGKFGTDIAARHIEENPFGGRD